jgi:peptidoglycan DL-endopeptidase CwlO
VVGVDSRLIAQQVADQLMAHRKKLSGKADDALRAHAALEATAKTITEHHGEHKAGAATATSHWDGESAAGFDRRARRMSKSLEATAAAAGKGATIVAATHAALDGGYTAVNRLVDEYTTRAAQVIDAGRAVQGAGSRAAMMRAVAQVVDLVRTYTNESAKQLAGVQAQMKESARQLKALEREVEHDGVADGRRPRRKSGQDGRRRREGGSTKPNGEKGSRRGGEQTTASGLRNQIRKVARGQLGYHEGAGNANKYGPKAAWCSSFATWVWRKSGVKIPILPFTGDVYNWGRQHGLAYGNDHLGKNVRPGDVLLFGTGPQSPQTSTHIGIVESVNGDKVTLIEGNSSDQVRRVTHTLSGSTFYGGVHPR